MMLHAGNIKEAWLFLPKLDQILLSDSKQTVPNLPCPLHFLIYVCCFLHLGFPLSCPLTPSFVHIMTIALANSCLRSSSPPASSTKISSMLDIWSLQCVYKPHKLWLWSFHTYCSNWWPPVKHWFALGPFVSNNQYFSIMGITGWKYWMFFYNSKHGGNSL